MGYNRCFYEFSSPNADMCDWGTGTCVEAQMNPIMTLETSLIWPGMGLITEHPGAR